MTDTQTLLDAVLALCPEAVLRENADRPALTVPPEALHGLLARLRNDPDFRFRILLSHTAVDWMEKGEIELLYLLASPERGLDLMVTASVPRETPQVATVSDIWPGAEWQEREVYDMFGVLYDGHPDLRRLLLDDAWVGHPLRRDYKDDYLLERPA